MAQFLATALIRDAHRDALQLEQKLDKVRAALRGYMSPRAEDWSGPLSGPAPQQALQQGGGSGRGSGVVFLAAAAVERAAGLERLPAAREDLVLL